jgi:hypothetical protein
LKPEPYLFVGLGAFLGANARYVIGGWAAATFGPSSYSGWSG